MPILDPSLMNHLILTNQQNFEVLCSNPNKSFFIRYLIIASKNLFRNLNTIKSSIQFKNDVQNNILFLNKLFNCSFDIDKDFNNPTITDFYRYFYDKIDMKNKKIKSKKDLKGSFFYDIDTKLNFFIYNNSNWFFTTIPVAILRICLYQNPKLDNIKYLNLEVDLMLACGFTVVFILHISYKLDKKIENEFIELMKNHNFSEIHIIISNSSSNEFKSEYFMRNLYENIDFIQGYIYLYVDNNIITNEKNLKKFKKKPFFQYISFISNPIYAINDEEMIEINPFIFCKNGFENEKIFLRLSNVSLYNSEDDETDLIPSNSSGISTCYISPNDFLTWQKNRIKILYENETENNDLECKYINFDDIHLIRPDFYVKSTLYLANADSCNLENALYIINKSTIKSQNTKRFKKEHILALFNDSKITKGLIYMIYAYNNFQHDQIKNFSIHKNQAFTALEACRLIFNSDKNGIIYQLETGEGKSCIICIISAFLALMKKTVHIASSNITLAIRDYHDSFKFFDLLGLKSAILLHFNELPVNLNLNENQVNKDDYIFNPSFFPSKFFRKELFENSSNMNFSVCGINDDNELTNDKADIIFSTFVNFECLYLRMMEMCPAYVEPYFNGCSLIIDEADSILIDELTHGTILSRSMKTNGSEILEYVYKSYEIENKNADEVFNGIKEKWPICEDINKDNIIDMFNQIDLIKKGNLQSGVKYSIIEKEEKEIKSMETIVKDTSKEVIKRIKNTFSNDKIKENSLIINDIRYEIKKYKEIIPFDNDHKGVLEPNKEFSGFVQQFIAIKEKFNDKNNENMKIKDISMNYLYVSHPIFAKLYKNVCGLTGTIGNKYDRQILKEYYNFDTMKIPRENPNYRIEYPPLLCENIKERNCKIVNEIIEINKKGNPVLVIFLDLNEISEIFQILLSKGFKNVNIFDGRNEQLKPDKIAGINGSISLGTNVCGRGTNVQPDKPLHVIISYFTSNSRVIYQAFGRTARQGQKGSVRIICLKNQFLSPIKIFNNDEMNHVLDDFQCRNNLQKSFINRFSQKRKWIFSGGITNQILTDDQISYLRNTKININRLKVCNYVFPICISIKTFLLIQAQKVFSLYNCPNCKYTWMLFQKYVREMILESWSLFIEKTEKEYFKNKIQTSFIDYLNSKINDDLYSLLFVYLPENKDPKENEIIPTFMNIFKVIRNKYEKLILNLYPKELHRFMPHESKKFCTFTFGFKPYSLIDNSGSKINTIDGEDAKQTYINDPELKYSKKQPNNHYSVLSITEKIDGILNMICQKINNFIGSHIGLRFFLRRTLGGCEFGICYDFDIEFEDESILNDRNCLVDKDPLLVFTISVKSFVPFLAGILIIGLVYIANIARKTIEWLSGLGIKDIIIYSVKEVASVIIESQIDQLFDYLNKFLYEQISKQIEKMKIYNPKMSKIFKLLLKIAILKDFTQSGDMINSLFEGKVRTRIEFINDIIENSIPGQHFFKTGFLLLLCFVAFMLNFNFHKQSIKYDNEKVSSEFDKKVDERIREQNENENIIENEDAPEKEAIEKYNAFGETDGVIGDNSYKFKRKENK